MKLFKSTVGKVVLVIAGLLMLSVVGAVLQPTKTDYQLGYDQGYVDAVKYIKALPPFKQVHKERWMLTQDELDTATVIHAGLRGKSQSGDWMRGYQRGHYAAFY